MSREFVRSSVMIRTLASGEAELPGSAVVLLPRRFAARRERLAEPPAAETEDTEAP